MLVAAEDAALNYRWSCATLKKCVQLWRTSTNNFKDRFNREALDREARLADDAKLNNVLNELLSTEKSFVAMLEELNHRCVAWRHLTPALLRNHRANLPLCHGVCSS